MLSSKEILERTGLSRATLNNYISAGLIPRPSVLPPGPDDGGAPRIGYFPDDTIARIEDIQRLKREGWSLGRILDRFAGASPAPDASAFEEVPADFEEPSHVPSRAAHVPDDGPLDASPRMALVAVLAASLHDAQALWSTISVQDYFDVVNEVAAEVRRIAARHGGHAVRVSPSRFLCHFLTAGGHAQLAAALRAADAFREAVRELGERWKLRQGAGFELEGHAGLAAGEAWVSHSPGDLQVVGDVNGDAHQLMLAARAGTLLVTRDFIGRLPADPLAQVSHGVARSGAPFRPQVFARLGDIVPSHGLARRLADLPVTEFIGFRTAASLDKEHRQ